MTLFNSFWIIPNTIHYPHPRMIGIEYLPEQDHIIQRLETYFEITTEFPPAFVDYIKEYWKTDISDLVCVKTERSIRAHTALADGKLGRYKNGWDYECYVIPASEIHNITTLFGFPITKSAHKE